MSTASKSFSQDDSSGSAWPLAVKCALLARANRVTVWLQIAVGYALIEATLWTREGRWQTIWMTLAITYILLLTLGGPYSARKMGLTIAVRGSGWIIAGGLALAAMIPLLAALMGKNLPPTHALPFRAAWLYAFWALGQQFILQSFFFVRLESVVGSRSAVLAAATLFAVAHLPNPILTVTTLAGSLFFCEMFRRYRNIFPLGLVHAILGLTTAASFSDAALHRMRVGIGYIALH